MKCLKCGWSNSDTAAYCQKCHAYLAEQPGMESIDAIKALILSLFFTGIFYLVFPIPVIRSEYWLQLFSGHISETIVVLVLWSLFLIFFKWRQFRQQLRAYEAFRNQIMHDSLSKGIYVRDVDERILEISQFMQEQKVKKFQDSVIFRRVRRTLRHLKAIPKKEEITSILNYQADIDHNRMQSGYALLNVFIWAIPILGFIGTVFGIGQSVGEFSDFIRSTGGTDLNTQMRSALGGVTSGLSVAFSTTFIALVGVVPIMMLASSLRKREEDCFSVLKIIVWKIYCQIYMCVLEMRCLMTQLVNIWNRWQSFLRIGANRFHLFLNPWNVIQKDLQRKLMDYSP